MACKDCRFFEGKSCSITGNYTSAGNNCGQYVNNTTSPSTKSCKTCRFFEAKTCKASKSHTTPGASCGKWSAFR
jgi:hypothetical protein